MNTIFKLVWKQFSERKLRSFLTMLGICIGIAALISLILLSSALKGGITRQLDRFGTDVILIAPKASLVGSQGGPQGYGAFTDSDLQVVRNVPQVREAFPLLRTSYTLTYGREEQRREVRATIVESADKLEEFIGREVYSGRYFSERDRNQVMVGYRFAKEAFDKEIFVGSVLRINGDKYTVAGILIEEGDQSEDFLVIGNIDDLRRTLGDSKAVTAISARITPGANLEIVEERIIRALKRYRGEEDFGTTTPAGIKSSVGDILGVVDLVVYSIALISLFVAALGVMNSLYTSVFQRTKEIGTMKAIGAKNSQILQIFVLESSLMGFLGGILGILLGLVLAYGFISLVNVFGFIRLELEISYLLLIGALLFSTVVGLIAGLLPALGASKLKPVDALRFE
jgi:putative ABC transport system permease protein